MSYHLLMMFILFMFAISFCMFVYKWRMGQIEVVNYCHGAETYLRARQTTCRSAGGSYHNQLLLLVKGKVK